MTPMGTNLAELDGTVGPAMLAYFEARAKGGCGLIMPAWYDRTTFMETGRR